MFIALEGLAGMGAGSSRSRTPTVASVLNLNSLNAPTCTALRAGGPLLSWRMPDAQALGACSPGRGGWGGAASRLAPIFSLGLRRGPGTVP